MKIRYTTDMIEHKAHLLAEITGLNIDADNAPQYGGWRLQEPCEDGGYSTTRFGEARMKPREFALYLDGMMKGILLASTLH